MDFKRKQTFYERYIKRFLDVICALLALVAFGWLYILVAIMVRIKMGKPVLFKQPRPGKTDEKTGKERIFNMYKFRTMTEECDESGKPLSDEVRLTRFGRLLRATSLDELPQALNILKGDMSVIGPRPQLVRDLVFMTDEQRMRHSVRPGLSGLAQVMGRNAITWEEKIDWDLKYIEKITFLGDLNIIRKTFVNVFVKREEEKELEVTDDYGDVLLKTGAVSKEEYDRKQQEAKQLLETAAK